MKPNRSPGGSPLHQTVAEKIEFESAGQSIQIEFTDQQLRPHAGTATFWSFLHQSGWRELEARCLPHPTPTSNHALPPLTKVLSFVQGLLCGAKKLTHVAYLRRDPMMPELLGIKRVPSQSTFTRFFQGFTGAGQNLACFRPLFAWAMTKLPGKREGYALDLDSTRLRHEDGHQDGVAVGYTTRARTGHTAANLQLLRGLVLNWWLRESTPRSAPRLSSCTTNAVYPPPFANSINDLLPSGEVPGFTREAEAFAGGKPMQLNAGEQLLEMVRGVQTQPRPAPSSEPDRPAATATQTAPSCPNCGSAKVLRTAKCGLNAGNRFGVCSTHTQTKCKGTRPVE